MYIVFYMFKFNIYVWKYFFYIKIWYVFLIDININKYLINCYRNIVFYLYVIGGKNLSFNLDLNLGFLVFCVSI